MVFRLGARGEERRRLLEKLLRFFLSDWTDEHALAAHTHSPIGISAVKASTRPCLRAVTWIVGHFVALWEILSVEPVVQLHTSFFFPFYFDNHGPICSFIHLSAKHAGSTPSPLTPPLPQLHTTTHYLQEDGLKSKSPLFSFPCVSLMPKISLAFSSLLLFLPPLQTEIRWGRKRKETVLRYVLAAECFKLVLLLFLGLLSVIMFFSPRLRPVVLSFFGFFFF